MKWKLCRGFDSYEVSDRGDVRRRAHVRESLTRRGKTSYSKHSTKVLRQYEMPNGYMRVGLYNELRENPHLLVHRLVCEAFHGSQPEGKPQVDHLNGVRNDNRVSNLQWASLADQKDTARRLGTLPMGESHYAHKLSDSDVALIRKLFKPRHRKYGAVPMGRRFGVTRQCISAIVKGINR